MISRCRRREAESFFVFFIICPQRLYRGEERRKQSLSKVELALRNTVDKVAAELGAQLGDAAVAQLHETALAARVLERLCAELGKRKGAPPAPALFRALHRHQVAVGSRQLSRAGLLHRASVQECKPTPPGLLRNSLGLK